MMLFSCPQCGHTKLFEHERGPTVTRVIQGIDTRYNTTVYEVYWSDFKPTKWWTCAHCSWQLPVKTMDELIVYLDKQREEHGHVSA